MNIKILTPEVVVFEGPVDSILVPGINGEFHLMKNHAAIVSALKEGKVKLFTDKIDSKSEKFFTKENHSKSIFSYAIKSGVIEFNNDKGILLCE